MHRRNPTNPVIALPVTNIELIPAPVVQSVSMITPSSPVIGINGNRNSAPPMFDHHASVIALFSTAGSDSFTSTACSAINRDDRNPKKSDFFDTAILDPISREGATPRMNPEDTSAAQNTTRRLGAEEVWNEEIRIVRGSTNPRAI